ncbi:hypothetical protein AM493_07635 [Flavobacterium akiainvivens]|uniref:Methionyl-tRNA formyltransferase n=1 Tax=Flavobacterium akiainvivens TaxID=1202724 RepID=A0A0M8MHJ5_9FLAO|nr:DUF4290 domain-containing protein [Flavobacterium akiainvivens]KOS05917.1 hypothetical protein AM493_07635 [Flavobacterium akiainvivens]SFQ53209.1 protein of unknown function [Flavobacterium akiainvivens]
MKYKADEAIFNLEYNAERPHLIIPEYGRHLQKLIEQAVALTSRDERNKAAKYIISVMGSLNPHLRDVPDFQHKLWDQLFIMSDFKIDVDSPYPLPSRETLNQKPGKLEYPQNFPKYRFYGNNIKYMIDVANSWEDGEMKNALIMVIANHMKKSFLSWNKDTVEDTVIFEHLLEISGGRINLFSGGEELSATSNLMKVNKKTSNKAQFSSNVNNGNAKSKQQPQRGTRNNQNNNNRK